MTNPLKSESESKFDAIKYWIIRATGVLVVIPALIYAGIDIYKAWQKIPLNDSEAKNQVLFKKYFGKPPLHTIPIPIRKNGVIAEIKFSVFEEGDIYIEYGNSSQWFESPLNKSQIAFGLDFSLIPEAHAQSMNKSFSNEEYQQEDQYDGALIRRSRQYYDGATETIIINPRTGQILERQFMPPARSNVQSNINQRGYYGGIDLDNRYEQRNQAQTSMNCVTSYMTCQLLERIPIGERCFCKDSFYVSEGIVE